MRFKKLGIPEKREINLEKCVSGRWILKKTHTQKNVGRKFSSGGAKKNDGPFDFDFLRLFKKKNCRDPRSLEFSPLLIS